MLSLRPRRRELRSWFQARSDCCGRRSRARGRPADFLRLRSLLQDLAGKALTDGYDVIELKTAGPTRWPKRVALRVQDIDVFLISSLSEPGNYLPISLFSSKLLLAFGCRHACTYA